MKKNFKNAVTNTLIIIMTILGVVLILYPMVIDSVNRKQQFERIDNYDSTVKALDNSEFDRYFEEAQEYNRELSRTGVFKNDEKYRQLLNVDGNGIMGYVMIPSVNIMLPIYHSTDADVLNVGVGHYQSSSLPVGGADTHAVISAHTGLPSARLFTDIEKLKRGDTFMINVLDRELVYEVEDIFVIKPEQTEYLSIIPGGDYVTLMTCTPYGINTHRLLVRSRRVETAEDEYIRICADAVRISPMNSYLMLSFIIFVGVMAMSMLRNFIIAKKNKK